MKIKRLNEAHYGGAFDIADDQYFTREDVDNAAEKVLDHISETFKGEYHLGGSWFENGKFIVNIQDNDYNEYEASVVVDMRKIKRPSDLADKYALNAASEIIKQIKENTNVNESFTMYSISNREHEQEVDKLIREYQAQGWNPWDSKYSGSKYYVILARRGEDGKGEFKAIQYSNQLFPRVIDITYKQAQGYDPIDDFDGLRRDLGRMLLPKKEGLNESSDFMWDSMGNGRYRVVHKPTNLEADVQTDFRQKGRYILVKVDGKRIEGASKMTKAEVQNRIKGFADTLTEAADVMYVASPTRGDSYKTFTSKDKVLSFLEDNVGYNVFEVSAKEFKSLVKAAKEANRPNPTKFAFNRLHSEKKTKAFNEDWRPGLTDCPGCGDTAFDSKRGKCTKCNYVEEVEDKKMIEGTFTDKVARFKKAFDFGVEGYKAGLKVGGAHNEEFLTWMSSLNLPLGSKEQLRLLDEYNKGWMKANLDNWDEEKGEEKYSVGSGKKIAVEPIEEDVRLAPTDLKGARKTYDVAALEKDILTVENVVDVDFDLDMYEELSQVILLTKYSIPFSDNNWYVKRKQIKKDVIKVAKKHGLVWSGDTIEDYGDWLYFVFDEPTAKNEAWSYEPTYDKNDGWTDADIELHKATDWKARNYAELPVPEDSFMHTAVAHTDEGTKRKSCKFVKYIRANSIFPPYYKPETKPFEDVVGPMHDGEDHNGYGIHNRYESQDVYDALFDSWKRGGKKLSEGSEDRRVSEEFLERACVIALQALINDGVEFPTGRYSVDGWQEWIEEIRMGCPGGFILEDAECIRDFLEANGKFEDELEYLEMMIGKFVKYHPIDESKSIAGNETKLDEGIDEGHEVYGSWSISFTITLEGEEVSFDDLSEVSQEHIAKLIGEGYVSGEVCEYDSETDETNYGWWSIDRELYLDDEADITWDGLDDASQEYVADMIKDGYTSGELCVWREGEELTEASKSKKISLYINGEYICSSTQYSSCKEFVDKVKADGKVEYQGHDGEKLGKITKEIKDTDKVTARFGGSMKESVLVEEPVITLNDDDIMNPGEVDFKKKIADATAEEEAAKKKAELDARKAEMRTKYQGLLDKVSSMPKDVGDNYDRLEALFDELVPHRGKATSVAGELVRAVTRLIFRYYNDGDVFYWGYGLETCASSASYLADRYSSTIYAGQAIGEKYAREYDLSHMDGEYESFLRDISEEVIEDILANPELIAEVNETDSREYDADWLVDEQPRFDYDFMIGDGIEELLEADIVSNRDVESYVEDCLQWESTYDGVEVSYDGGDYVYVSELTYDGFAALQDRLKGNGFDHFWEEFVESHQDELDALRDREDDEYDDFEDEE